MIWVAVGILFIGLAWAHLLIKRLQERIRDYWNCYYNLERKSDRLAHKLGYYHETDWVKKEDK